MSYSVALVFPVYLQVQEVAAIAICAFCIFGKLAMRTEALQRLHDRL